ncbi:MAG: recombinase family protein [Chloroflexi bacterium]|nr:recombinase family protein [Chloroflexota bacterium]
MGERPDGRHLLEDARAGRFQEVLVYRLDRLGRSLRALLTLGVPLTRRYGGGRKVLVSTTGVWPVSRINFIIRNPVYKGLHVFKSRGGPIEREVPALVSRELW